MPGSSVNSLRRVAVFELRAVPKGSTTRHLSNFAASLQTSCGDWGADRQGGDFARPSGRLRTADRRRRRRPHEHDDPWLPPPSLCPTKSLIANRRRRSHSAVLDLCPNLHHGCLRNGNRQQRSPTTEDTGENSGSHGARARTRNEQTVLCQLAVPGGARSPGGVGGTFSMVSMRPLPVAAPDHPWSGFWGRPFWDPPRPLPGKLEAGPPCPAPPTGGPEYDKDSQTESRSSDGSKPTGTVGG
jgi:hypothetical protein